MIRKIHLFLGLFLAPWILMYALSSIAMQHREIFYGSKDRVAPDFELVKEVQAPASLAQSADSKQAALIILQELDLEGAHGVRGKLEEGRIQINRDRPIGSYRIVWEAAKNTVTVEKQRFGMTYFLEMLHRRRGFNQPYWANDAWGIIVDGVITAILLWAFTGLWMWWKMKSTHKLGTACVFVGTALFACFIFMI